MLLFVFGTLLVATFVKSDKRRRGRRAEEKEVEVEDEGDCDESDSGGGGGSTLIPHTKPRPYIWSS